MLHPSNPRLMNRVLDAVVQLSEAKGSTARDVLDFLRQSSKTSSRNLTMQVHRALKHAVNAGLLRHRSGRYKVLFTLNPAPAKQAVNENNDEKLVDGTTTFDAQAPTRGNSDRRDETGLKHKKQRRNTRRKRSGSRQRRRKRQSRSKKRENPLKDIDGLRKLNFKEKRERDRSSQNRISDRMKSDIGHASTSSSNRKRSKVKPRDQEYYSDLSESSDSEDNTRSKGASPRKKTPARQECKYDGRRSASRNRSPQRQQSQLLQMEHMLDDEEENKMDCDNCAQSKDKDHEPNNSGSGSTL